MMWIQIKAQTNGFHKFQYSSIEQQYAFSDKINKM